MRFVLLPKGGVVYKSDTNLMGVFLLICGMGHAHIKGAHLFYLFLFIKALQHKC